MMIVNRKGDLSEVSSARSTVGLNWPGESPDRPLGSTGSHNFCGRQVTRMRMPLVLTINFLKNFFETSILIDHIGMEY